jgi:chromosome segregation ATPase
MKTKLVIVVLAVVCVGLAIAFFATKQQSEGQHVVDVKSIGDLSNQVVTANQKITEINQVNLELKNDVLLSQQQLTLLSNNLTAAAATLENSKAALAENQAALTNAQAKIADLNIRIADLDAQNQALDLRAGELTNTVAQLNLMITATRSKLALSENNGAYLQQELQKQMAQKAEIEHKFNDLDELRQQVKKVKTDLFVARRGQLMKYDNSQKKGAELLISRALVAPSSSSVSVNYGLNVEVGSDGSVRVIPPLGAATNAPAR